MLIQLSVEIPELLLTSIGLAPNISEFLCQWGHLNIDK